MLFCFCTLLKTVLNCVFVLKNPDGIGSRIDLVNTCRLLLCQSKYSFFGDIKLGGVSLGMCDSGEVVLGMFGKHTLVEHHQKCQFSQPQKQNT